MLIKETRSLFKNAYQYKIVLVCAGAHLIRYSSINDAIKKLQDPVYLASKMSTRIKTKESAEYSVKVLNFLKKMESYETRIESPLLTIYSNNEQDINKLSKINEDHVKYICRPPKTGITEGFIIMPKIDYDFRVTIGRSKQPRLDFIEWADKTGKVKLTKSCRRDLTKDTSWGGTHFYISGDKNLLVARIMLGNVISKVEKIVKNI